MHSAHIHDEGRSIDENKSDDGTDETVCPICLDHMQSATTVELDCNHTFHAECIVTHFRRGDNRCPCCRNTGDAHNRQETHHNTSTDESTQLRRDFMEEVHRLNERRRENRILRTELCRVNDRFQLLRTTAANARRNVRRRRTQCRQIQQEIRRATPQLHSMLNRINRQLTYHRRRMIRCERDFIVQANSHLGIQEFGWAVF